MEGLYPTCLEHWWIELALSCGNLSCLTVVCAWLWRVPGIHQYFEGGDLFAGHLVEEGGALPHFHLPGGIGVYLIIAQLTERASDIRFDVGIIRLKVTQMTEEQMMIV